MNARPDPAAMSAHDRPHTLRAAPSEGALLDGLPSHDARRLTGSAGQARILLDGQVYSLRITRAGKLILTK